MTRIIRDITPSAFEPEGDEDSKDDIKLDQLLAAARRQSRIVVLFGILGVTAGLAYAITAVPMYTATATLLIDNRKVRPVQDAYDLTAPALDSTSVDSQVEVLKSKSLAVSVINGLELKKDAAFAPRPPGFAAKILAEVMAALDFRKVAGSEAEDLVLDEDERRTEEIAGALGDGLAIRRVGRTLALEISFTSPDRRTAAGVANGFADAYLTDQLESKYDATRRASTWLEERLSELKQKAVESDLAVQRFKTEKGLVSAGGNLLSEQQLAELTTQLVTARGDTARAEARYQRIATIVETRQLDAAVSDSIDNTVIEQLRAKFVTASKRESEISSVLGPNHIQAANLRNEMKEYQRLIFLEMTRIAQSYKSDVEIAKSKQKALEESLAGLITVSAEKNEDQVQLREMQREADTFRNLYQSFLQRYQETLQQQSFPITEARIISRASVPERPSHPKKILILALSGFLGGVAGIGFGAYREYRDRGFRTGEQVRSMLGIEFLGMMQAVKEGDAPRSERRQDGSESHRIMNDAAIMRHVLDKPLSSFAETLRSAKLASDLALMDRSPKIIGVVSVLPGEGKTTVAKNFASLLAHQGARTLLVDADLRNPSMTRALAPHAQEGLVEVVLENKPYGSVLLSEPGSNLSFLPAVVRTRISHTAELISSTGMKAFLAEAGASHDYIILDLPPIGPVVDARAAEGNIDAFLFVAEWGKTARRVVRAALDQDRLIKRKCLGGVLNKVDAAKLKLYAADRSKEYYYGRYTDYYVDRA
ncbi:GNVR domain-containing protein [Prosthecomicrobium sp. N25]|uniref:GNVR domain-containing protein n=1 Tax=Prosthecomicrobium sp. N25 TaxID=3129254 RepID=UPI0030781BCC